MGFAEIVGHQKLLENLRSALRNGRLHHAYLLLGPDGVGKRTIALALAKAIHCTEKEDDFCGECVNCLRISDSNHPDLRVIGPLTDKKEISIQQIRELERELNYRSFTGKRKIAVIDPAPLMNAAAQNALLKTLEEPPDDCLMILIAANSGGLLPTVRSRCLRLSFAPLPRQEVTAFIRSKVAMNSDDAEFLAALSMGSIGATMNLDKNDLLEKRRVWSGVLDSLKANDYQASMVAAEAIGAKRSETLEFLQWAETWYRDLLIHSITQQSDQLVNLDMLEQIEKRSAEKSPDQLLSVISQISGAGARIQRNLNRRMVVERFLFGVVGAR
jgi:DNA polymerase-3 subunit delta'